MAEEYYLLCTIHRGAFSGERRFEIELPDERRLVGMANVKFLRDSHHRELDENTPRPGQTIEGYVQFRPLRQAGDDVLIELPGSEVVHVSESDLSDLLATA